MTSSWSEIRFPSLVSPQQGQFSFVSRSSLLDERGVPIDLDDVEKRRSRQHGCLAGLSFVQMLMGTTCFGKSFKPSRQIEPTLFRPCLIASFINLPGRGQLLESCAEQK